MLMECEHKSLTHGTLTQAPSEIASGRKHGDSESYLLGTLQGTYQILLSLDKLYF